MVTTGSSQVPGAVGLLPGCVPGLLRVPVGAEADPRVPQAAGSGTGIAEGVAQGVGLGASPVVLGLEALEGRDPSA